MALISRVKNLLLSPAQEWPVIAQEKDTATSIVLKYLLPLSLFAALAFYLQFFFITGAFGFLYGLYYCVLLFVQLIITICLNALIVDKLAPTFESHADFSSSLRLMIYAGTPVYVGSLLAIIPVLGWIGPIVGLVYSIYLLFLGLPILKKTPSQKVPGYLVTIVICLLVIYFLLQMIVGRILLFTYV